MFMICLFHDSFFWFCFSCVVVAFLNTIGMGGCFVSVFVLSWAFIYGFMGD